MKEAEFILAHYKEAKIKEDPEVWREFLDDCVTTLLHEQPLQPIQAHYLGSALQKILLGEDPKRALRINPGQGNQTRPETAERNWRIAWYVAWRIKMDGIKKSHAIKLAVDEFNLNKDSVRKAYNAHKGYICDLVIGKKWD